MIDTDLNFRYGKSEKTINAALNYLQTERKISRNQIFISTKCGYLPNDIDSNLNEQAFKKILIEENIVPE